jgi:alkanesulfonate monooxygenase SsuD/methylene tetrahydromethanopterin reductase-like flavin-dependent oxidoreductase (luciferase family)
LSAWLFAGESPGAREWAGGACIVLASALSSWVHRSRSKPVVRAEQAAAEDTGEDDEDPDRQDRSRAMV